MRPLLLAGLLVGALSSTVAHAKDAQHTLAVSIGPSGVTAKACKGVCSAVGGKTFPFPAGVNGTKAKVQTIKLRRGASVSKISAPMRSGPGEWVLLLAASLGGETPGVEKKLSGVIGRPKGLEGERKSDVLLEQATPDGTRLFLGRRYENASLCGRPTVMRNKELNPSDLLWKPAATQSLTDDEKVSAARVRAKRLEGDTAASAPQLLHAVVASSALGRSTAKLTDHKLATRWAENKPGDGAGEFVVMTASADVMVDGFEIIIKPTADDATGADTTGAAPKELFIATRNEVFAIRFPDDAWAQSPGTRYGVDLPTAVKSDCFGLVLGEAYGKDDSAQVSIAELRATSRFDDEKLEDLVIALDRDKDADGARALLMRSGNIGAQATIAYYAKLSENGRQRALEVIEAGDCATIAPFFVDRVLGIDAAATFDPDLDRAAKHARERLRLCKPASGKSLVVHVVGGTPDDRRVWAARELATILPNRAIDPILEVLEQGSTAPQQSGGKDAVRRGLRHALSAAARHKRATQAVTTRLGSAEFAKLSLVKRIDLLRAVGEALPKFPGAQGALDATLAGDSSFRTRYLLLEPAAHLARGGSEPAAKWVRQSMLKDENQHVRARAAAVAGGVATLGGDLHSALEDKSPRVREAALHALTESKVTGDEAKIVALLDQDPWSFVRIGAAQNLSQRPTSEIGDKALVTVLADREQPGRLRRASLRALGKRKSMRAAADVRRIADNPKEPVHIRVAALSALGDMCDAASTELFYKLALRAGYQQIPYDQPLGLAALAALGKLKPADLSDKLAPLFVKNKIVPPQIRSIARNVVKRKGQCQ